MKKKALIIKAVVIPLAFGIVLFTAFILAVKPNIGSVLPVNEGTEFAFFDSKPENSKITELDGKKNEPGANDTIGCVKLIGETISIKYNCDYSNMAGSLSMQKGNAHFGETGCVYLSTLSNSGEILNGEKDIDIESIYGNYRYVLVDSYTADNEFKILNTSSGTGKSLVIYYQISDGKGLSSEYRVLVYEEVE